MRNRAALAVCRVTGSVSVGRPERMRPSDPMELAASDGGCHGGTNHNARIPWTTGCYIVQGDPLK